MLNFYILIALIFDGSHMKNKYKGYTLIELLISLGIMSFIVTLSMTFFITNVKNYEAINNDTRLQFQAQYILNFVSNKIMESKKVVEIRTGGASSVINSTREFPISKMSLLYNEQESCYIFEVRNNKIYYGNGKSTDSATVELGTYILELRLAPYPDGVTFAETKALKITIKLSKDNQVYEANQIIYMRSS